METSASLLERIRTSPDEAAWQRLDNLYRPLIRRWLLRDASLGEEVEDVAQEIMSVLIRELPRFQRRRCGSFRHWLRTIAAHRLGAFYRSRQHRPLALGCSLADSPLMQMAARSRYSVMASPVWIAEHAPIQLPSTPPNPFS